MGYLAALAQRQRHRSEGPASVGSSPTGGTGCAREPHDLHSAMEIGSQGPVLVCPGGEACKTHHTLGVGTGTSQLS